MSELKTPKMELVNALQQGELTPQEAVENFEHMPVTLQTNGRIYKPKSIEERAAQYRKDRKIRADINENRTPFVSTKFLPNFWLAQGLIVVGAESGKAKSTTCANVLQGFLSHNPYKTAIVISNEEASDAVYERTACVALEKDYMQYFKRLLTKRENDEIRDYVLDHILPRVEVVDEGSFDMSYLEDVQSVLNSARINHVGIVLIDYLQIITQSRENPQMETYRISKELGLFLKSFGKQNGIPVVCFAQLHSSSRGPTMAERVQNDKTFFNHGYACIEVIPDFETLRTNFKVHKDRFFGASGKEIGCDFKGGRYVFAGDDAL